MRRERSYYKLNTYQIQLTEYVFYRRKQDPFFVLEFCPICGMVFQRRHQGVHCNSCAYVWRANNYHNIKKNNKESDNNRFRAWTSHDYCYILDYFGTEPIAKMAKDVKRDLDDFREHIPIALKLGRTGVMLMMQDERENKEENDGNII